MQEKFTAGSPSRKIWPLETDNQTSSFGAITPKKADEFIGIGGAPTRPTILPDEASERKKFPLASGLFDYFPDALIAVSHVSWNGNNQHNPGQPLHWDRAKSTDEADTMLRHFSQRGQLDSDGQRHSAKMAWRALAILQKEIESEKQNLPRL